MDYTTVGGKFVPANSSQLFGAAPDLWDFGRVPDPTAVAQVESRLIQAGNPTSLYDVAPHLKGIGENKTTMLSHFIRTSVPALNGKFLQSQHQPRGTCVSRGAKRIADLCQALAIAFGTPFAFDYISHAYIYGTCREHGGFLSNEDGAVGAWAAWSVANDGNLRNSDVGDDDNKDDLAVLWGTRGVPSNIKSKGRLHLVKKVVPIRTYEEARDWIASGIGGVTVASNVGYEGQRDTNGVVRRRGRWAHQMCYTDQREDNVMKALLQNQSWGPNNPEGPVGNIEIPGGTFWTIKDDVEQQLQERDAFGFAWVDAWDAQNVSWRP